MTDVTLTGREAQIIVHLCAFVLAADPVVRDLLDPSAQLSPRDLADIRDLRAKIGGAL
jgi:hypothetical protein